ncbi:heme ABC exporter ATP-binding protein CcmA [Thermaerobacter subterraneus]|uniref:Heme ABC exporter, ATP-binding protein CcmA n=1 Tax=Thermaerobacter subterraneus DSM 13965 TaxID=867903 RepID=K6Q3Z5_9FIRM|nr:heme ABC exporter ATP-binding protein CcmA [Thermaerobacter subterraneus]EKP95844.1 heme ABC exporter, ATP-binding protein CcmA [Thermaerobacter subterraneus DSM 13965]
MTQGAPRPVIPAGDLAPGSRPGRGAPVLELAGLERAHGDQVVFRSLHWRLGPGEVGAVMGPNGAGKTTLLQVVAGLLWPSAGTVRVAGAPARPAEPAWRRRVGYVGHRPLAFPELSAWENLIFFGRLYGLSRQEAEERARELLDRLNLDAVAARPAAHLSRGLAQRLEVARAMMHRPLLWLWDEPFTGLDAGAARLLENLVEEHAAAGGTAVVVLHEPDRALRLAGRLLLLAGGSGHDVPAAGVGTADLEAWLAWAAHAPGRAAGGPAGGLVSPAGAPGSRGGTRGEQLRLRRRARGGPTAVRAGGAAGAGSAPAAAGGPGSDGSGRGAAARAGPDAGGDRPEDPGGA